MAPAMRSAPTPIPSANFVVTATTAAKAGVTFPLHSGARNATTTNLMSAAAPNGDCNNASCHGGTQGWIHVP